MTEAETFTFTKGEIMAFAIAMYVLGILIGLFVWGPQVFQ